MPAVIITLAEACYNSDNKSEKRDREEDQANVVEKLSGDSDAELVIVVDTPLGAGTLENILSWSPEIF